MAGGTRIPDVPESGVLPTPLPAMHQIERRPIGTPYEHPYHTPEGEGGGGPPPLPNTDPWGRALGNLTKVGQEYAAEFTERANIAAVQGASATLQGEYNAQIADEKNGYASLKGFDAVQARDKAITEFGKTAEKVTATLNPQQQRMFAPHLLALKQTAFNHVNSHEAQQAERYAQSNFEGNVDQITVSLEKNIDKGDDVEDNIDKVWQASILEAQRRFGSNASKEAIASVAIPKVQRAAYRGMDAALSTQDPAIARQALDILEPHLLLDHKKNAEKMVEALEAKGVMAQAVTNVFAGAIDSVAVPGGDPIPRVNELKVAAHMAALPPDTPGLEELTKHVDAYQKRIQDLYKAAGREVAARVYAAGEDPVTGNFNLQDPRINPVDKAWLAANRTEELTNLKNIDLQTTRRAEAEARAATLADRAALAQQRREQKDDSARAASTLSADMSDPEQWAAKYFKMTPGEFLSMLNDPKQMGVVLTDQDRKAMQNRFAQLQQKGAKLDEPAARTVKDVIAEAYPEDDIGRKQFTNRYFESLRADAEQFAKDQLAAGVKVKTEDIATRIREKMQRTEPQGIMEHVFVAPRQIERDVRARQEAAKAKTITGYRYSGDRSKRIPVFSDNTEGAAEPNR